MCLLYLKKTSINYKEKAILFVKEFENVNSYMAGSSNLDTMYNNKGSLLYDMGMYDESVKCCNKAIEINSGMAHAYKNKANS